jgi:hypothetical protein
VLSPVSLRETGEEKSCDVSIIMWTAVKGAYAAKLCAEARAQFLA